MKSNVIDSLKMYESIEKGLSQVYSELGRKSHFSPQVKKFWTLMAAEEAEHAQLFREIWERFEMDSDLTVDTGMDPELLELFTARVNRLVKYVKSDALTDSEAYKIGAFIEAELDESKYLSKLVVSDPGLRARLRKVHADTSKHRIILVNHSRGIG